VTSAADLQQIDQVLATFFAAFTSGPDVAERLERLRDLLLPQAVITRTCGTEPVSCSVDEFLTPRLALLTSGTLTDFSEWPVAGRTDVLGDLAQHLCTYAKRGVQDGVAFSTRGVKSFQLVRMPTGWRVSALIWDDEREGLTVPDEIG
jgi:hypothetical protein